MTCDDAVDDGGDADFQRWYFGGSPPESDGWPRHAFEEALLGVPRHVERVSAPSVHQEFHRDRTCEFAVA